MSRSILACSPERDAPGPGTVLRLADCGHNVWISQSGLQAIEEHDLETRCIACLPTDVKMQSLPGIQKEAEQRIGPEAYQRILARLQNPANLNQIILAERFASRGRRWR